MASPNSSRGGGVMRNHRSQPPHRPAPYPTLQMRIVHNNTPLYDGGVMVVDDRPVSSAASHGGGVARDPHSFSRLVITITRNVNNPPNSPTMHGRAQAVGDLAHNISIRQEPAPFNDGGVMVLDAHPVSSAAEEMAATPQTVNGLSEEMISRFLKTTVIEKQAAADGGGDPEVCSICLDLYREKQRVGVLRCRHQFHANCIGKWLRKKNVCPLCNAIGIARKIKMSCRCQV